MVKEQVIPRRVMPLRLRRTSLEVSLKAGVKEWVSEKGKVLLTSSVL